MSVERADRTGPTGFDSSEWNRAANRVMPPSTPSSKTTSAWLRPIWGRALGALSIFTTRTGRFDRTMSIGSPVRGDAAGGGGAGTAGGRAAGPNPGEEGRERGGAATFGFVVTVVDVAGRVVVVVGFGRVVVVVDVDVVVVGGGSTVSTRRKSVPQALPDTRRRTASVRRSDEPGDMRWRWGRSAVMSTADGSGSGSATG